MGGYLARWVCTLPSLSNFTLTCDFLPEKFLLRAAESASTCQIRKLHMSFSVSLDLHPTEIAVNLAKFLCGLHFLERAYLQCNKLPVEFYTTTASNVTRSKVEGITINGIPMSSLQKAIKRAQKQWNQLLRN
ncbi:uncharacterized protein [Diadema antillarum]|uniref:uncharacterized protein isoform X2 n=1 Tax=Diadema antillarum TaxID=105358 RepID=UPI003A8B529E